MIHAAIAPTFDAWQLRASQLLVAGIEPASVIWSVGEEQPALPGLFGETSGSPPNAATRPRLNGHFTALARRVVHHASEQRWARLYRVLWRLTTEDPHLLDIDIDEDVAVLRVMERQVRREAHRMKAFVRFRHVVGDDDHEWFIAWYRAEHPVLPLVAPFFVERFRVMRWAILTPFGSARWDRERLTLDARELAPPTSVDDDAFEPLWRTYYEAVSNPARLNLRAMRRDMPGRLWPLLPETKAVPRMITEAAPRVAAMRASTRHGARPFVPARASLDVLRAAAATCQGCDLHRCGSRVVFGEGPPDARIVLVGEQPGDVEDRSGRPFVGPAGEVLDAALAKAGIARDGVYLTNAVKHFRFVERGKRRIHQTPRMSDVADCRPWLEAELAALNPETVVCLGATASKALLGATARVNELRGRIRASEWARRVVVTVHPWACLRARDDVERARLFAVLVDDLRLSAAAA